MVAELGLKAGQLRDWGTKPGPVIVLTKNIG